VRRVGKKVLGSQSCVLQGFFYAKIFGALLVFFFFFGTISSSLQHFLCVVVLLLFCCCGCIPFAFQLELVKVLWVLFVVLFFCALFGFSALRIFMNFEVLATTLLLPLPAVVQFCCCGIPSSGELLLLFL
jgi:hypothetical protein